VPGPVEEDPFTIPLAIAAHDRADAPTWLSGAPPEAARPDPVAPLTRRLTVHGLHDAEDPDDLPLDLAPGPPRESPLLLLRRGVLLAVLALGVAAAVTAWPYLATSALLLGAWLLRTCTMVVTAAGVRRRLRGARWYDVLLGPLSAPWYLVLAIPGAVLLALWALGISAAGLLVCYAAGLSVTTTLAVSGLCLALGLWVGPGSGHVRWPVRVVAQSVSRSTLRWAVATVLLVGLAGVVGHQAGAHVGWSPFGAPFHVGAGS
jgi:hypothetical protein